MVALLRLRGGFKMIGKCVQAVRAAQETLHAAAQILMMMLAAALVFACVLAAAGGMPWPQIALFYGGQAVPQAGMWLQLGLTGLMLLLMIFLPGNLRIARLERSHRSFAMGMEDVARAYARAHAADRAGAFALSGEFEAMRERMQHLRQHPDLQHLEPELLQLAAQMSLETRELARTYADDKVDRAKRFLKQRQEEVTALTDRLGLARRTCDELRRWLQDIEAEERAAQTQIRRLEADLKEILPALGYDVDMDDHREPNVVQLPMPGK